MTQLSDTQLLILSAAAKRDGNIALPLPTSLRGGAAKKVVGALLAKGYLAEVPAGRTPGTLVWDETDDGGFITLVATADGLTAIGIEPKGADAPDAEIGPDAAPDGATEAQSACAATEDATSGEGAPAGDTVADDAEAKTPKVRAGTKQAKLIEMLRAPDGASIEEIVAATGWQPHTIRGAIAGALKKKLGLEVVSEKVDGSRAHLQIACGILIGSGGVSRPASSPVRVNVWLRLQAFAAPLRIMSKIKLHRGAAADR